MGPAFPEIACFRGHFGYWREKTVFSAHQPASVYQGLTVVRFLARRPVSNTACELS
jgi:hypothetical protein